MPTEQESSDLSGTFIAYRTQLRGAAQKILGTRDLAEEVTQEAYLKVTDLAGAFAVKKPLAYCFQVVRNLAIDYRRRRSLESHLFANEEGSEHVPAMRGTPEQLAINQQNLQIIDKVLDSLPARTRHAFEMYRLSGLTQRDIAKRLGVSATLVNFMIREASDALNQCRHLLASE